MGFTQGPCEHDLNRIDTLQFGGGLWSNPTFEQWTPMEARKFRKEQHPQHPGEKRGCFLTPQATQIGPNWHTFCYHAEIDAEHAQWDCMLSIGFKLGTRRIDGRVLV